MTGTNRTAETTRTAAPMDTDQIWRVIDAERASLADLLDGLTPEEWELPSPCEGWRVRDVAAHLTLAPRVGTGRALLEFARARGSFDRMVRDTALREAARPTAEIVAELRGIVGSRRLAPSTTITEPLLDVLVHGQDIALALGRRRAVPAEPARIAADRVWSRSWPFRARRRLNGLRLTATDADWRRGEGEAVSGPMGALLLVLTGRTGSALPALSGPGVPLLAARETAG
ncbi:maleylpyruvate isomerase family mycothiol-dependent enzyme [Streptomyces sp. NPDC005805]|uniref:maleylpyruvate isomerase family mycothiol-dependent enzyme n=1 Tax=Streptomyces sp. NPDC005805 TaxID=3157068 RepID=UPI003401336B